MTRPLPVLPLSAAALLGQPQAPALILIAAAAAPSCSTPCSTPGANGGARALGNDGADASKPNPDDAIDRVSRRPFALANAALSSTPARLADFVRGTGC
jgi:hypothetical protein